MKQPLFSSSIIQAFNQSDFKLSGEQSIQASIATDIPRDIHIDNAQPVFERLRDILHNALNQVRAENISLADLRRLRISFYEARDQFFLLEEKERADVIDLERNVKWHERSKLVRVFVSSEAGEQLDREKQEAQLASTIAKNFANHLKDLEEAIDQQILFTGERNIPEFNQKIVLWRKIGSMKQNAALAKDKIAHAYAYLSEGSCSSCGGSIQWATQGARSSLASADKNMNGQLQVISPWYDQLTKEVENKVDEIRGKLMMTL